MKLSLAITTYNRIGETICAFANIEDDERIDEIIIVDDCSDLEKYDRLAEMCKNSPKVKLFRNEYNMGMSLNKKIAVEKCSNDWVILFDSDNVLNSDYIDALFKVHKWKLNTDTIYCPVKALPNFDYSAFSDKFITIENSKSYLDKPLFDALLNTCNYVVYRETYLKNYSYNSNVKASDTVWYAFSHLIKSGTMYIVPNMQYEHTVHSDSGFLQDADYNLRMAQETLELIREQSLKF